jgi:hypothetical protein
VFERVTPLLARLMRYSLAMVGPVGSAGAQLLLSLVLLRTVDASNFGSFSFLLVASQLSWGVWSALFCAPLPILLSSTNPVRRERLRHCLQTVNLLGAVIAFPLFALLAILLGAATTAALLFAGYGFVSLLRWFARAHAYATGEPLRTTASDVTYSLTLIAGIVLIWLRATPNLELAWGVLLVSTAAGLLPFGRTFLAEQFIHIHPQAVAGYASIWRQHSGWSLFGVITTEATANSHTYLVTILLGPTAFAPIAASALMIRPINVTINALIEFERAQMARQIGDGRYDLAMASARFFRIVLVATWLVTAIGIVGLLAYAPRLIFPANYPLSFLTIGAALWMAVAGMRLLRTPDSALLQAAGAFRPLAFASMWSSGVSVVAVLVLLVAGGPLWSIGGILAGETIFAVFTWREARLWWVGSGCNDDRLKGAMI